MTRQRGWYWPWLIAASLLFTVGVNVVMVFAATADPNGTVVEPDYYRKGVEWDRTMAQRAASERLGWSVRAEFEPGHGDSTRLVVHVTGRDSLPVLGVRSSVELIHNRAAARPMRAALVELGGGRYAAPLLLRHAGLWEVRLAGRRGSERLTITLRVDLPAVGEVVQ